MTTRASQFAQRLLTRGGVALVLSWSVGAMAQQQGGGDGQGGHRGPPPKEALAACTSSKTGDSCSFTGKRGLISGTCQAPQGKPLGCKPSGDGSDDGHGQSGQQDGPPPSGG